MSERKTIYLCLAHMSDPGSLRHQLGGADLFEPVSLRLLTDIAMAQ